MLHNTIQSASALDLTSVPADPVRVRDTTLSLKPLGAIYPASGRAMVCDIKGLGKRALVNDQVGSLRQEGHAGSDMAYQE
jgi:hypothetical protein